MSSIITSILGSTVGLLWNKARERTADKLKDGDVTDTQVRAILVRELDDVKGKIDGLSRKDLLSSHRYLKEGAVLLNLALDKTKSEGNVYQTKPTDRVLAKKVNMPSDVEFDLLAEASNLSRAIEKLKICSNNEFESAMKRFEESRKKATEAFCNEALSIKDRIFAAKLRLVSEILECLENPETAIVNCLSFLQELHSLPAIRETFSVYLTGGVKSILKKAERVEIVKSVMMINYVLYHLNFTLNCILSEKLRLWPGIIELPDRSFNPIQQWKVISGKKAWGRETIEPPNQSISVTWSCSPLWPAINSHYEIVTGHKGNVEVFSRIGEKKLVAKLPERNDDNEFHCVCAVGSNNNVYIVRVFKRVDNFLYVLNILDESYNLIMAVQLDFLDYTCVPLMKIAINLNNEIIIMNFGDSHVYVCDEKTGELKHKFELNDSLYSRSLSVNENNEIMIPSSDNNKALHMYSVQGKLKWTMEVPEGHEILNAVFHFVIAKIIVLTYVQETDTFFLHCFSARGKLENSMLFPHGNDIGVSSIQSHPSGPVAFVTQDMITFI